MKSAERRLYMCIIKEAMNRLVKALGIRPESLQILTQNSDFVIVKTTGGTKYMVKLCHTYWDRCVVDLTGPEIHYLRKNCVGIIFCHATSEPHLPWQPNHYNFHLLQTDIMANELSHYVKRMHSVLCLNFRYEFYSSRIFTYGKQL